jgi:hypothetical protein
VELSEYLGFSFIYAILKTKYPSPWSQSEVVVTIVLFLLSFHVSYIPCVDLRVADGLEILGKRSECSSLTL